MDKYCLLDLRDARDRAIVECLLDELSGGSLCLSWVDRLGVDPQETNGDYPKIDWVTIKHVRTGHAHRIPASHGHDKIWLENLTTGIDLLMRRVDAL